jgi:hypothetical protein
MSKTDSPPLTIDELFDIHIGLDEAEDTLAVMMYDRLSVDEAGRDPTVPLTRWSLSPDDADALAERLRDCAASLRILQEKVMSFEDEEEKS